MSSILDQAAQWLAHMTASGQTVGPTAFPEATSPGKHHLASDDSRHVLGQMAPADRPAEQELTPASGQRTMQVINNYKLRQKLTEHGEDPDAEYGGA